MRAIHIFQLKEKLESTTAKMLEYRAQMETNKLELKKTQKALQNEVGEQYNVHDILSNKAGTGWRGRQQKIIELQTKLQVWHTLMIIEMVHFNTKIIYSHSCWVTLS